jgi:hypothetical protein
MIKSRRLAYKPIANLFALIVAIGFNLLHPQGPHVLFLAIFMIYVAASQFMPRLANIRTAGKRHL